MHCYNFEVMSSTLFIIGLNQMPRLIWLIGVHIFDILFLNLIYILVGTQFYQTAHSWEAASYRFALDGPNGQGLAFL